MKEPEFKPERLDIDSEFFPRYTARLCFGIFIWLLIVYAAITYWV